MKYISEAEGLGFARQVVVKHAQGRYIIWVDGDIIISSNYVKTQVDFMDKHPDAGVAVGNYGFLKEENWVSLLQNVGYVIGSVRNHGKETSRSDPKGSQNLPLRPADGGACR